MRTSAAIRADIEKLEQELRITMQQERSGAREKILAILKENDMTLADIVNEKPHKPPRPSLPPKYVHPDGRTWSGQGRMPLWLVGEDKEKYLLPASA